MSPRQKCKKNCAKFSCERLQPRLLALSFLTIVLGGTAALHAYRAWGAVIFWGHNVCLFLFAHARHHALARLRPEKKRSTLNVKYPMANSAKPQRISWPIAAMVVALIVAITIVVIFLRLESWPARTAKQSTAVLEKLGRNLGAAFVDIAHLQPRITINNRVYMEQTIPVSEVAVLSRQIEVEHELLHTWVGSSKRVKLHGTFLAKAGFDLQQGLSIDIRPEQIDVRLPHARILGIEQQQLDVLEFENGLWNRISGKDLQSELSILPQLAWKKAAESDLPFEAEQTLQRQLEDRIHSSQPLRLVFKNSPEQKSNE
jgi:energy-converting hydrogenase Eha subunit A